MKTNSLVFEKYCDLDQQIPLKIQQIKKTHLMKWKEWIIKETKQTQNECLSTKDSEIQKHFWLSTMNSKESIPHENIQENTLIIYALYTTEHSIHLDLSFGKVQSFAY